MEFRAAGGGLSVRESAYSKLTRIGRSGAPRRHSPRVCGPEPLHPFSHDDYRRRRRERRTDNVDHGRLRNRCHALLKPLPLIRLRFPPSGTAAICRCCNAFQPHGMFTPDTRTAFQVLAPGNISGLPYMLLFIPTRSPISSDGGRHRRETCR